jgi:hypothetical protein
MPKVTAQESFAVSRINKRDMESQVVRSGTEGKQAKSKVSKPKPVKPKVKRSSTVIKKP